MVYIGFTAITIPYPIYIIVLIISQYCEIARAVFAARQYPNGGGCGRQIPVIFIKNGVVLKKLHKKFGRFQESDSETERKSKPKGVRIPTPNVVANVFRGTL